MIVYPFEQRCKVLRHYFENHGNIAECVRKLHTGFGRRAAPSAPYAGYLVKNLKETGILIDKAKCEKPKHCVQPRILLLWHNVCVKRHRHQFTDVLNN